MEGQSAGTQRGAPPPRRAVYLCEVTLLNAPYVLWLARRYRVLAWRVVQSAFLSGRVEQMRPFEMFSRDEWLDLHETCFDAWRSEVLPRLQERCRPPLTPGSQGPVDFAELLWQLAGAEFQKAWLFLAIARRHASLHAIAEPRIFAPAVCALAGSGARGKDSAPGLEQDPLWSVLEATREWLLSGAHAARLAFGTVRATFMRRLNLGRRPHLWRGISPREIPAAPHQVDFAWAVHDGWLDGSGSAYFPPVRLAAKQRRYLRETGVAAIEPLDEFRIPARLDLWANLVRSQRCAVAAARWRAGLEGAWLARLALRGLLWGRVAETLGARFYFTTTSSSWPEQAELAVFKPQGVRSITWAYSANSLTFAWHQQGFRDVGVERSLLTTDEFWVWNDAFKRWLENRRVGDASRAPGIRVVGALMCGDSRHLQESPEAARKLLGLPAVRFMVGVFDMPAISVAWKQRHGGGPSMIEPEYYAGFLKGVLRILREVPDAAVILKLKRSIGDWTREYPEELHQLVDSDGPWLPSGRVHVVDADVDPYLPVAGSDMTVGMPFTSPVLAGLSAGRPGCYYDPSRIANWSSAPALRLITLQDGDALVQAVRSRGANLPALEALASIIPPTLDRSLLRDLENA